MKITKNRLKQIIKEELSRVTEALKKPSDLPTADGYARAAIAAAKSSPPDWGDAETNWDELTDLVSGSKGFHSVGIRDEDPVQFEREVEDEMSSARAQARRLEKRMDEALNNLTDHIDGCR